MDWTLYRPTFRQAVGLAAVAAVALSYGFVMRYAVIQNSAIGIACETATTWLCTSRRASIALFQPQVFGIAALGASLLNLLRPSFVFVALALLAGGAGIVLYNTALSALAVALLIVSLARPAPGTG
jgi:hypothetical protein